MKTRTKKSKFQIFDYVSLTGYLPYLLLFIIPVIIALSFSDLSKLYKYLGDIYYQKIFLFTILQAFLSSVVSIIIGLPGAFIFSRVRFKSNGIKKVLQVVLTIPFVLPSILVVLGFVIAYGNSGLLNKALIALFNLKESPLKILYTLFAVVLAHSFCNFPLVINNVSDYIRGLNIEVEEAGRLDGLSEFKIFLKITLPRILQVLLSTFILIFLYCYTSFSIVLVLGGKPSLSTIGLEIYSLATRLDYKSAGTLSLISIFTVLLVVLLLQKMFVKKSVSEDEIKSTNSIKFNIYLKVYLAIIVIFALFPVLSIVFRSCVGSTSRGGSLVFTLSAYKSLFSDFSPVINTVVISLLSALLSCIFALLICSHLVKCKTNTLFLSLITVSMSVSSVILGFGYMIISKYLVNVSPFILLVFSHAVIVLPLCIRIIYPPYKEIPKCYIEDAVICGASKANLFFHVIIPLLKNPILSSFIFSFALSNGELGTSLLIGGRSFPVLSVQIYRLINSYNYQGACAYGTVMLIFVFFIFLVKQ